MKKCKTGHFYNPEKHKNCPYCPIPVDEDKNRLNTRDPEELKVEFFEAKNSKIEMFGNAVENNSSNVVSEERQKEIEIENIENEILRNNIDAAIIKIKTFLDKDDIQTLSVITSTFHEIKQQNIKGLLKLQDFIIEKNKIVNNLFELLNNVKEPKNSNSVLKSDEEIISITPTDIINLKIGNYIIVDFIKSGGFGAVFKAKHRILNNEVAIKISHGFNTNEKRLLEIMDLSIKTLKLLKHKNIINTIDFGEYEILGKRRIVLIMDYIDGGNLDHLKKRNLTIKEIDLRINIFLKICKAISFSHNIEYKSVNGQLNIGLFHGDIKPENILLTNKKEPKVADFMFVDMQKIYTSIKDSPIEDNNAMFDDIFAKTGELFGTSGYMSPEQILKGDITVQSDIFSLGATLFNIFTDEKIDKFKFEGIENLHDFIKKRNTNIPIFVSKIIFNSICIPKKRYKSVKEMIKFIKLYLTTNEDVSFQFSNKELEILDMKIQKIEKMLAILINK